jgi:hypothetical protein
MNVKSLKIVLNALKLILANAFNVIKGSIW